MEVEGYVVACLVGCDDFFYFADVEELVHDDCVRNWVPAHSDFVEVDSFKTEALYGSRNGLHCLRYVTYVVRWRTESDSIHS